MKAQHRKKPSDQLRIAEERIVELFKQAEDANQHYANRYVEIARKIAMKYKLKMPSELRKRFCKKCGSYLRQGVNCRVRTRDGKLVYYCVNCNSFMRFPGLGKKK